MSHIDRPDLAGTVLGDFELVKQIGTGNSGDVYEAIYRANGKRFALKLLAADATDDAKCRFRTEFKVLSTLEIKGLVAAYHFGELADGQLFFTTDLLPGRTFEDYLRQFRRAPADLALEWTLQICHVVRALHLHGVLHRDLKPGNLQIDDQGELTLFDLGSCKCTPLFYAETERRYITGPEDRLVTGARERRKLCTLGYLASEATKSEPSPSLDIYSIGAILHRILFGHTPDCRFPEVVSARATTKPDELLETLECAIAEDPTDRYQSLTRLITDLDLALEMVRLELGLDVPDVREPVSNDDESDPAVTAPPHPIIRRIHRIGNIAALGLTFILGWSLAQVNDNSSVKIDRETTPRVVADHVQVPSQALEYLDRHADRMCTPAVPSGGASPPAEATGSASPPAGATESTSPPATGSASPSDSEESRPSPRVVASRRKTEGKPTAGKGTFERDLRTRMTSCQFPSQTVTYEVRDGKLNDLKFEHPPGNVQRTCMTQGFLHTYGDRDFRGQLSYRGDVP